MNLFRDHPREALLVMALTAGGTASFYAYTIYMQKFLANTSGFDRATASQIMTVALTIMLLIQPFAGRLSDRVGTQAADDLLRRDGDLFTYPIFVTLEGTSSVPAAFALVMAALVMVTGYTSINAIIKAEMFPADIRALGVALPVRHRQRDLRRHGRICRVVPQGHRPRALVLHLHLGARRLFAGRLHPDAGNEDFEPNPRRLISALKTYCIPALGVVLLYAVGNSAAGGTAEHVALWFEQAGAEGRFYRYLSTVSGMAAIAFLLPPKTKTKNLILEE